jgi:hypothetical protein
MAKVWNRYAMIFKLAIRDNLKAVFSGHQCTSVRIRGASVRIRGMSEDSQLHAEGHQRTAISSHKSFQNKDLITDYADYTD